MSPRRIAKVLVTAGILCLTMIMVSAVWLIKSRERQRKALQRSVSVEPGSLLHARNFHWTQMKGDKEQWELAAGEASYGESRSSLILKDAKLTMTMEDGKPISARAHRVDLSVTGNHVNRAEFRGGLALEYGDIKLLTTDATFMPDQDLLEAPGLVQIQGEGFKINAVGLEARPRARTFSLKHEVSTELTAGARNEIPKHS